MATYNDTQAPVLHGRAYVYGNTSGRLIASSVELSFWGGVSSQTGDVIDYYHPLSGMSLKDAIVAIPVTAARVLAVALFWSSYSIKRGRKRFYFNEGTTS